MPKICKVPYCDGKATSFHQFPQDPILRAEWLRLIRREDLKPNRYQTVCSKHFGKEHFRQPNNETPARFRKVTLIQGSLPTYNLPDLVSFGKIVNRNGFYQPKAGNSKTRSTKVCV